MQTETSFSPCVERLSSALVACHLLGAGDHGGAHGSWWTAALCPSIFSCTCTAICLCRAVFLDRLCSLALLGSQLCRGCLAFVAAVECAWGSSLTPGGLPVALCPRFLEGGAMSSVVVCFFRISLRQHQNQGEKEVGTWKSQHGVPGDRGGNP